MRADELLLDEKVDALLCTLHSDARPLRGTAAYMDWHLEGFLSRFARAGKITGEMGELVYVPVKRLGSTRHLFVVGLGPRGKRPAHAQARALSEKVARSLRQIKAAAVAVSCGDFSEHFPPESLTGRLHEMEVMLVS